MKPPLQSRSARTLERILEAAEALIVEEGVDGATVSEVAKRARSSVGAFYARFDDKDALLRCVFERFMSQAAATVTSVLAPERWREVGVETVVEALVAFAVGVFRERRRLIAAFTIRAASDPDVHGLAEQLGETIAGALVNLLDQRDERLRHPDPRTAVRIAVWVVLSALEARTLRRLEGSQPIPDSQLATEVTRMCLRYLGVGNA